MSTAAASAPAPEAPERGPASLLPAWAARLVGFAALACLGVAQWQRMVAGAGALRVLLWVALAVGAGAAVVACDRLAGRRRSAALIAVAAVGLLAAYVSTGLGLGLLRPARWDQLASGLSSGAQALSTVRLPYEGADVWPAHVLELLGACLVMLSALLAFWPRAAGGRGYPFLALAALLVLAAAPVVSLGGTRPLLLGAALTLLTVCFLWLERLPLRPGLGVAALVGLALAGALPIAAAADRGEPWFDYASFAEGLGPKDPIHFDWEHGDYGPMTWGRTGAEVLRVRANRPEYWKLRTLDDFDGSAWDSGGYDRASADPTLDVPANWQTQRRWQDRIEVSVQRMEGSDVAGAGTTMRVDASTRPIEAGYAPGQWQSIGDLRSGDSYSAEVFVPRPTPEQLAAVPASSSTEQAGDLSLRVHLRRQDTAGVRYLHNTDVPLSPLTSQPPDSATVTFPPYGREGAKPEATYHAYGTDGDGAQALRISYFQRTWRLAQQLKAGTSTPYGYVLAVSSYLKRGFTYTEKPPAPAPGVPALESFLLDTKAGYCQHFSGAMALLLRMGGIPARVATGFTPGGYSKRKQAWIVRDTDAHSWVEAWFEGYGWVTLDPTPSATPARSQIATISAPVTASASADGGSAGGAGGAGADAQANRRAAGSREALFDSLRGNAHGGAVSDGAAGRGGSGLPVWPLLLALGLVAVGGAAFALRRRTPRPDDPLDRAIFELETALRRSGRRPPAGTTLRELERRLGVSGEAAGYLRAISQSRYGGPDAAAPTNAQRRALRRELASGLGWIGRLRTFWALPPRAR